MSNDPGYKTERRDKIDGGLDLRSGPFGNPDRVASIQNLNYLEKGSLVKRRGALRQAQKAGQYSSGDIGTPTAVEEGSGTFSNGTYYVAYTIKSLVTGLYVGTSPEATVTVSHTGTQGVTCRVWPNNNGELVGTAVTGIDVWSAGYDPTSIDLYIGTVSGTLYKQAVVGGVIWDGTNRCWTVHANAYSTAGATSPGTTQPVSGRSLFYFSDVPALLGWWANRCYVLSCAQYPQSGNSYIGITNPGLDGSGNKSNFSMFPSKIYCAVLDGVLVATDGIGKPKKLDWPATPGAPPNWFLLGGVAPVSAPTVANKSVAGSLTGTYRYRYSYVYATRNAKGVLVVNESDPSPVSNPAVTVASSKMNVTMASTPDSSILYYRIYRTADGGSVYYHLYDLAAGSFVAPWVDDGTVAPNTTWFPIGATQDEEPNTPPLASLWFIQEYAGRLWAVLCSWGIDQTTKAIETIQPGSVLYYTKYGLPDAWPADLGIDTGMGAITGLLSHKSLLYIFKYDRILVLEGAGTTDDDFQLRTLTVGVGAMPHSVVAAWGDVYFWDPNQGPMKLDGYSVKPVGTDSVQVQWGNDIGYGIRDAVFDSLNNQVKWVSTQMSCGTFSINAAFKEYVAFFSSEGDIRWTVYVGGTSAAARPCRQIMGTAIAPTNFATVADFERQRMGLFILDTYGAWSLDDQLEYDTDPTSGAQTAIPFIVTFMWLWGGNPEMVKVFKHLYLMYLMGSSAATDYLLVYAGYPSQTNNNSPTYVLVTTLYSAIATAYKMLTKRLDIQQQLQGNLSQERGLLIQIQGSATTGPVKLQLLSSKFKELDDLRNAP